MNSPQSNQSWDDADLVAYLDGELSEKETLGLERQLSSDQMLRQRVSELEKAWNLLDVLPEPAINATLAQSTIELLALELMEDRQLPYWKRLCRRPLIWVTICSAAAILVGGATAGLLQKKSMHQMALILPVLTNLPELNLIDNTQWLERLAEIEHLLEAGLPLYTDNAFPNPPTRPGEVETWIDGLDTNLRVELSDHFSAFQALPVERKNSIVRLQQLINSDSQPDYAQILKAYSGLVRQIGSAELAQLQAEKDLSIRSEKLQQVVYRELAIGYSGVLSEQEREGIRQWANQVKESNFEYFFGIEDPDSEIILMLDLPMTGSIIDAQDIAELIARINPSGQSVLERLDENQRSKALRLWVFTSLIGNRTRPTLSTQQLKDIFDSLPVERQNELIYMSGNEVIKMLKESISMGNDGASISSGR
jgi:hypothetical protein